MVVTDTGKVVDVHAHVALERFRKAIMQNHDWYGMTPADGELENPLNHWGVVDKWLEAILRELRIPLHPLDVRVTYEEVPKVPAIDRSARRLCACLSRQGAGSVVRSWGEGPPVQARPVAGGVSRQRRRQSEARRRRARTS